MGTGGQGAGRGGGGISAADTQSIGAYVNSVSPAGVSGSLQAVDRDIAMVELFLGRVKAQLNAPPPTLPLGQGVRLATNIGEIQRYVGNLQGATRDMGARSDAAQRPMLRFREMMLQIVPPRRRTLEGVARNYSAISGSDRAKKFAARLERAARSVINRARAVQTAVRAARRA